MNNDKENLWTLVVEIYSSFSKFLSSLSKKVRKKK